MATTIPLIRMSEKGEEYTVQDNRVKDNVRYLTGNIKTREGRLDEDVTFEIPEDVAEVILGGSNGHWYLSLPKDFKSWKSGIPYPSNEV